MFPVYAGGDIYTFFDEESDVQIIKQEAATKKELHESIGPRQLPQSFLAAFKEQSRRKLVTFVKGAIKTRLPQKL